MEPDSARSLGVISRIASAITSSGPVEERVSYALEELKAAMPYDTVILSSVDPTTTELKPVVTWGHCAESVEYFHSPEWHTEAIEPFCVPHHGRPFRECDLPVDPLSLRGIAQFFRSEELLEGTIQTLVTREGRYTGLLTTSLADPQPPSTESCLLLTHIAPALANLLDPMQSAHALAASLDDECAAVLSANGSYTVLRGAPPDVMLRPESPVRQAAERALDNRFASVAFLWPNPVDGWYRCRAYCCGDGLKLLTLRTRSDVHDLSRRELEVLSYLVEGLSNAAIAAELWVTTRTVRAHVEHILDKLEVPTRAAAVARALHEGMVLPWPALPRRDGNIQQTS